MKVRKTQTSVLEVDICIDDVCKAKPAASILADMIEDHRRLFKEVDHFIEADDDLVHYLWKEYRDQGFPNAVERMSTICIGTLCDTEIPMMLVYRRMPEKLLCFYSLCGAYAIWPFAEAFLKEAAPKVPVTKGSNFGSVLYS
jgi:hypothetical protein